MQKLILPLGDDVKITAGYKAREYKKYWGFNHYGVDMTCSTKEVIACGNGTVIVCGDDYGCGNVIVIEYPDCELHNGKVISLICTLMHLDEIWVKPGQKVIKGDVIAKYGNTGLTTTGPHLHVQFDSDIKFPLYCSGLSANNHLILLAGSVDSTINPFDVLSIDKSYNTAVYDMTWSADDWLSLPRLEDYRDKLAKIISQIEECTKKLKEIKEE